MGSEQENKDYYTRLDVPKPGSREAEDAGCLCPVMDNHYGKGYGGAGIYVISGDCPLHGTHRNPTREDSVYRHKLTEE